MKRPAMCSFTLTPAQLKEYMKYNACSCNVGTWHINGSISWRLVFGVAFNNAAVLGLHHRSISIWFGPFAVLIWKEIYDQVDAVTS